MAQKRMFDREIVNTDKFCDMPMSTKGLYFILGMEADDHGFVSPRRVMRTHGAAEDDLKLLVAKGMVILFDTGVIVITDWNRNNYLDSRRVASTEYQYEMSQLKKENGKYLLKSPEVFIVNCLADAKPTLSEGEKDDSMQKEPETRKPANTKCLAVAKPMLSQYSIEEYSTEEYIWANKLPNDAVDASPESAKQKNVSSRFAPPTVEDVREYCIERKNGIDPERFVNHYESKGWKIGKSPMKSWKAAVRTWELNDKKDTPPMRTFKTRYGDDGLPIIPPQKPEDPEHMQWRESVLAEREEAIKRRKGQDDVRLQPTGGNGDPGRSHTRRDGHV